MKRINHILFVLFNPIPFKNRTVRIAVNQSLSVALFLAMFFFPHMLYSHSVTYGNMTYYSKDSVILPSMHDTIIAKLNRAGLQVTVPHDIFLAETDRDFKRLAYWQNPGSIGMKFLFIRRIVVTRQLFDTRTPEDVVAHELTHAYLAQEFGEIDAYHLPRWKQEGCAEYVANASSLSDSAGFAVFFNQHNRDSVLSRTDISKWRYLYFEWRKVTQYLIDEKELSVQAIAETDINYEQMRTEAVTYFNSAD